MTVYIKMRPTLLKVLRHRATAKGVSATRLIEEILMKEAAGNKAALARGVSEHEADVDRLIELAKEVTAE